MYQKCDLPEAHICFCNRPFGGRHVTFKVLEEGSIGYLVRLTPKSVTFIRKDTNKVIFESEHEALKNFLENC